MRDSPIVPRNGGQILPVTSKSAMCALATPQSSLPIMYGGSHIIASVKGRSVWSENPMLAL